MFFSLTKHSLDDIASNTTPVCNRHGKSLSCCSEAFYLQPPHPNLVLSNSYTPPQTSTLGMMPRKELEMIERTDIRRHITLSTVRINDAVGHDLTLNDRHQRAAVSVRNHASINPFATLKLATYKSFFSRSSPILAFAPSSKVTLVNFDLAAENSFVLYFQFFSKDLTKTVKIKRGRVTMKADKPSSRPGWLSGNEMLNKTVLFGLTDVAIFL